MFDPLPFDITLPTRWLGQPLYFVRETDSTNRLLRTVPAEVAAPGTVLFTDYQSAGRGRQGRQWLAPPGSSLLFSLILPAYPHQRLSLLPLVTGIGISRALEEHVGLSPLIKWPNDLLLGGRKCGGILVESEWNLPGDSPHIVVGVGINVNQPDDAFGALPFATSLRAHCGEELPRARLFTAILRALEAVYDAFATGWEPHAEWSRRAGVPGQAVWVEDGQRAPYPATALALGADGELVVNDLNGNSIALRAGDVSLRYAQPEVHP